MKTPGGSSYALAMSDIVGTGTGIDHTFAYAVPTSGSPPDYIQGTYRFYTIATDVADNAELAPADPDATTTQTLQDSIAPALSVSHLADGSNGWNTSDPVTLTITSSDGGSGLETGSPSCLEGATALTLTPGAPGTWTTSVSGEGTHTIDCQATDKATNQTLTSDTVKIDTVDPTIIVSHSANGAGWNNSSPVSVTIAVSDDTSGIAGCPDLHGRRLPGDRQRLGRLLHRLRFGRGHPSGFLLGQRQRRPLQLELRHGQDRPDQAELARQLADLQQRRHDRRWLQRLRHRRLRAQAGRPVCEDPGRLELRACDERHRRHRHGDRPHLCLRRPDLR